VRVAGSNPVVRSKNPWPDQGFFRVLTPEPAGSAGTISGRCQTAADGMGA